MQDKNADYRMEEIMHITLTGNLGSGKSTICKILDGEYKFEIYSTGKVQRELAAELGITVLEMNQLMCTDHKYDKMIDDTTAKISRENPDKNIVFDSRLAWNFVEKSFKTFLSVDIDVAAERVFNDNRGAVEKYTSAEDAKNQLKLRAQTEDVRYKDIYGIEYFNFNNYNLVLDSTYATPELLAAVLVKEAKECTDEKAEVKILMTPKRLGADCEKIMEIPECFYLDECVKVKAEGDRYVVTEGMDIVEKAVKEGIPFVKTVIAM